MVRAHQSTTMDDTSAIWSDICYIVLLGHDNLLHVLGRGPNRWHILGAHRIPTRMGDNHPASDAIPSFNEIQHYRLYHQEQP